MCLIQSHVKMKLSESNKRITLIRKGQELKPSKLGEYPAYIGFILTCSHVYVVKSEFVNKKIIHLEQTGRANGVMSDCKPDVCSVRHITMITL